MGDGVLERRQTISPQIDREILFDLQEFLLEIIPLKLLWNQCH